MKVVMINDVVLEVIVVRTWKYANDLLFRLACDRIPDLPQKPLYEFQDAADFVTIQTMKGNLGVPVVEKNCHVRVHCFLHNPDYEMLFSILDGLHLDSERHYWIEHKVMEGNISDIQVDSGQISTGVEILLKMSHKALTSSEEVIK
jgi:hypothetical protein